MHQGADTATANSIKEDKKERYAVELHTLDERDLPTKGGDGDGYMVEGVGDGRVRNEGDTDSEADSGAAGMTQLLGEKPQFNNQITQGAYPIGMNSTKHKATIATEKKNLTLVGTVRRMIVPGAGEVWYILEI